MFIFNARSEHASLSVQPIHEAIETLVYDFLEETHDGWELNAGAYGQVVFDIPGDTIKLEYNERFEDSEYHEHTF